MQVRAGSGWAAQARQAIAQHLIGGDFPEATRAYELVRGTATDGARALPGGPDALVVRSPRHAERAIDELTEAAHPLLVVVPGTGRGPTTPGVAEVVRSLDRELADGMRAVYLQYDGTLGTATGRGLGATGAAEEALAGLLTRLSTRPGGLAAPTWLVAESQGSWVVANVARDKSHLFEALERVSLMSTPGLADTVALADGRYAERLLHVSHTDDIVPGLFTKLKVDQVRGFARALGRGVTVGDPSYPAHQYIADAEGVARFLRTAERPPSPVHHSSVHLPH